MDTQARAIVSQKADQQLNLLLVDDDAEDLFFLKRLLVKSGRKHTVMEASSVEQAFEKLKQLPDIILLDYNLGDKTGFDLIHQMRKTGCNLPVILLTGFDDDELDRLALSKGVADFLPKRYVNPVMLDRSIRYAYRDFMRLQQLEYLAHFDTLTGLCNRRLFMDRLEHAFEGTKRQNTTGALLYIDVDGFKTINDELGHSIGDQLLKVVAERMSSIVRSADTVARLGGDEFVILLENITVAEAHLVAQKLLFAMEDPIHISAHQIHCSLSIGLCAFSKLSESPHDILTSADRALYQAKLIGKHTYCSYNQRLVDSISRQMLIEEMTQVTAKSGDFYLHYQPRFNQQGDSVLGFEALARWPKRNDLQLTPDDFIPVLESLGLMDQFTCWVIDKALADIPALQKLIPGCFVSINVSPSNLASDSIKDYLLARLKETGTGSELIELEVTENVFLEKSAAAVRVLEDLRHEGIRVALDDFGTGYSSLSYLSQLPIDTIKLDRQFLEQVPDCERSSVLIRAVVNLAINLSLKVVAEGVESEAQKLFLQDCGCHELQGYLTGRPMSLDQLALFFNN